MALHIIEKHGLSYFDRTIYNVLILTETRIMRRELILLVRRAYPHIKYPRSSVYDALKRLEKMGLIKKIKEGKKALKKRSPKGGRPIIYWRVVDISN